jgi:Putative prokaryotic signal transducing protein
MSTRLITLATFRSPIEATLARNVLLEAGVRAELSEDTTNSIWGGMFGGVGLLVDEADVERAGQLLQLALSKPIEMEGEPTDLDNDSSTDTA